MSDQKERLKIIHDFMKKKKIKGNPRDYVVILERTKLIDVNALFSIEVDIPEHLPIGAPIWRRFSLDGKEHLEIVYIQEELEDDMIMITDEHKTKSWPVPRADLYPLPLTVSPMLIHKSKVHEFVGDEYKGRFWHHNLRKRVVHPR